MKKNNIKILGFALTLASTSLFSQIKVQSDAQSSITDQNPFLDASEYYVSYGNNVGKGLYFPRTDLTQWEFKTDRLGQYVDFKTAFDGMVVYNSGTGKTIADTSKGGQQVDVEPGFYYFSNPTADPNANFGGGATDISAGKWVKLGAGSTTGGTKYWALDGNGDAVEATIQDINNANYTITGGNFIGTTTAGADLVTLGTKSVARLQIGGKTAQDVGGTNFDFVLDVFGKARFRKGIVTEKSTYPDYVFEQYFTGSSKINPNYVFKSLAETEKFIKENNHLPGVTKITEFSKDGNKYLIDAADLATQNLEKVEELYLHTIEQQKEIETLKAEIAELKALIKK